MADEKTDELTDRNLLEILLERVDQIALEQRQTNARLIKVEAFVDDRSRDTRPRLDLIHKEIADLKHNDIAQLREALANTEERLQQQNTSLQQRVEAVYTETRSFVRQIKLLRDEIWGEQKERVELEERIEILERAAA